MDAYLYVRFSKLLFYFFLPTAILTWAVVSNVLLCSSTSDLTENMPRSSCQSMELARTAISSSTSSPLETSDATNSPAWQPL